MHTQGKALFFGPTNQLPGCSFVVNISQSDLWNQQNNWVQCYCPCKLRKRGVKGYRKDPFKNTGLHFSEDIYSLILLSACFYYVMQINLHMQVPKSCESQNVPINLESTPPMLQYLHMIRQQNIPATQYRWFILPSALFSFCYDVRSTLRSHMSVLSSDCRAQATGNIQAHGPPICLLSAGQGSDCTGNRFLIGCCYSTHKRGLGKVWLETWRKLVTVGLSFKGHRSGLRQRTCNNDIPVKKRFFLLFTLLRIHLCTADYVLIRPECLSIHLS